MEAGVSRLGLLIYYLRLIDGVVLRLHTFGGLRVVGDGTPPGDMPPRCLALLAILAAAGAKGVSREQAFSILWADSEPERARHSLSQALYTLRQNLGDAILTTSRLRLDPTKVTSDVEEFRDAAASKAWARAAAVFAGPFLDGFYVVDAPEFERWAEEERSALTHEVQVALEAAAREAETEGRTDGALESWRKLVSVDPLNARIAAAYAEALIRSGDGAKALVHVQSHADLVRRELEIEPDAAVLQLIERLRAAAAATQTQKSVAPSAPASTIIGQSTTASPTRPRRTKLWVAAASVLVVGAFLARGARQLVATSPRVAATVRPRSPLAERLFADGLRAFYQFDGDAAARLFNDAVKEDSSFAMAVYFAWRSESTSASRQDSLAELAFALASRAPERDRLLIIAHVLAARGDLAALPATDSLLARFPNDPEALIRAAAVTSDLTRAVSMLDRAIRLDSAQTVPTAVCRACDAFHALAQRYAAADSTTQVERTLERWAETRPADYQPWNDRADYLIGLGRVREASLAQRHADSLGAPHGDSIQNSLIRSLRIDNPEAAAATCHSGLDVAAGTRFNRYRLLCTIGLRMSGRFRAAFGLVREGRSPWSSVIRPDSAADVASGATLDMEMGRPRLAAVEYRRLAADSSTRSPRRARAARDVVWGLTLSATAAAMAADTVRVRSLVDSVELIGHRSLSPQDPLLHHFLRGVLLAEANQHEGAVREFRAAISSPSQGYTRINYELGKSLIALHRPGEAATILRAALHGGLDGPAFYLTRTETHELLAQAFDAAGQRDSAAAHYAIVERVWRGADSSLSGRHEAARQWLLRSGPRSR